MQWVVISYLLAVTTLVIGVGRLGDLFGRRRVLLSGIAVFAFASLACAASFGLWWLVAARALQGAGAAVIMALTIAMAGDAVPAGRIGSVIGLLGTVSAIGTAMGPTLGGVLVTACGWSSVFVAMAALGLVAYLINLRLPGPDLSVAGTPVSFDLPGFLLLVILLGCYTLGVTGGDAAPAMLGIAAITLIAFVAIEMRTKEPLVNMKQLRDRNLGYALVALALVTTIVMATLVIGPFYLTDAAGLSSAQAGMAMSIGPGIAALVGVPAGRLVDRLGPLATSLIGLASVAVGCASMILLPMLFGALGYVACLAPLTGGYALFQAANNTSIVNRPHRASAA